MWVSLNNLIVKVKYFMLMYLFYSFLRLDVFYRVAFESIAIGGLNTGPLFYAGGLFIY